MKKLIFIIYLMGSVAYANSNPTIAIDKVDSFADQPLSIAVSNLKPYQNYKIRSQTQDAKGLNWEANADFIADANGSIDLTKAKPTRGTYDEADGMGLFWSMSVPKSSDPTGEFFQFSDTWRVKILVETAGTEIASAQITRRIFDQNSMSRTSLNGPSLVGSFYVPKNFQTHAAVLVLGGSEGGIPEYWGSLVASHGFASLALAYFMPYGTPIPPLGSQLDEIPLEYFRTALEWLRSQPDVDPNKIYIMGGSRGGELVVKLASTYPNYIKGTVVYSGSGIIWQGIATKPPYPVVSAWTLNGTDVPFVSPDFSGYPPDYWKQPHYSFRPAFEAGLKNVGAVIKATTPVEKMGGPILLFSGSDDQVWPSSYLSQLIIDRLTSSHFQYPFTHIDYQSAGHGIMIPYFPSIMNHMGQMNLGGIPKATAKASIDAWNKSMSFLDNLAK